MINTVVKNIINFITYSKSIYISNNNRILQINRHLIKIYYEKNNKLSSKQIKYEILSNYYKETEFFNDIAIYKKILNGKNCSLILYFYYNVGIELDNLYKLCNNCNNKTYIVNNINNFCKIIEQYESTLEENIKNIKNIEKILEIKEYDSDDLEYSEDSKDSKDLVYLSDIK